MENLVLASGIRRDTFDKSALIRIALAALAIMLVWNFAAYATSAVRAIRFPFGLDYGEGIVWQQMRLLLSGSGYGAIDGFPTIVFHYPPLYHFATGLLAELTGMDQLAAGRLLSVSSSIVAAGFIAASVARLSSTRTGPAPAWAGGLLGALMIFTMLPVQLWSSVMRVDMLSLAFGFAGFFFGLVSLTRPRAIHIAAVLFVAAIYTKQTAIAAPAAVFLMLLFLRPRTALAGIATTLGLGLVALAAAMWLTDGGFMRHILLYNINRFYPYGYMAILRLFLFHMVYMAAALLGIHAWLRRHPPGYFKAGGWQGLRQRLLASPSDAGYLMALTYLAVATLMLLLALKSGASSNYFIEWTCVVALFAGLALADTAALASGKLAYGKAGILVALLPAVLAFQALFLLGTAGTRYAFHLAKRPDLIKIAALVKAAPGPVISDDMVVVLRGGKAVVWEPAIFAELASNGVWDERPLVEKIKAREFGFFITDGRQGQPLYDSRYSPAVSAALRSAYPVERKLARYTLHFPDAKAAGLAGEAARTPAK